MSCRIAVKASDDDYVQAGELYRKVLSDTERDHLISNIVGALKGVKPEIQSVSWRYSRRRTAITGRGSPKASNNDSDIKITSISLVPPMTPPDNAPAPHL